MLLPPRQCRPPTTACPPLRRCRPPTHDDQRACACMPVAIQQGGRQAAVVLMMVPSQRRTIRTSSCCTCPRARHLPSGTAALLPAMLPASCFHTTRHRAHGLLHPPATCSFHLLLHRPATCCCHPAAPPSCCPPCSCPPAAATLLLHPATMSSPPPLAAPNCRLPLLPNRMPARPLASSDLPMLAYQTYKDHGGAWSVSDLLGVVWLINGGGTVGLFDFFLPR